MFKDPEWWLIYQEEQSVIYLIYKKIKRNRKELIEKTIKKIADEHKQLPGPKPDPNKLRRVGEGWLDAIIKGEEKTEKQQAEEIEMPISTYRNYVKIFKKFLPLVYREKYFNDFNIVTDLWQSRSTMERKYSTTVFCRISAEKLKSGLFYSFIFGESIEY